MFEAIGDWFEWLWNLFLNNVIRIDPTVKTVICFVCFFLAIFVLIDVFKKGLVDKDGKDFNIKKVGWLNYLILILCVGILIMYMVLS